MASKLDIIISNQEQDRIDRAAFRKEHREDIKLIETLQFKHENRITKVETTVRVVKFLASTPVLGGVIWGIYKIFCKIVN